MNIKHTLTKIIVININSFIDFVEMMQSKSIARELALLVLGQIPEDHSQDLDSLSFESVLNKALQSLMEYCREGLDGSAGKLEVAQQHLLEVELQELDQNNVNRIKSSLNSSLNSYMVIQICSTTSH